MKKKEVEKFVDEVGMPLYEELTKVDNEANKWVDSHPEFVTEDIRIKHFRKCPKCGFKPKLLKKKNEEETQVR